MLNLQGHLQVRQGPVPGLGVAWPSQGKAAREAGQVE